MSARSNQLARTLYGLGLDQRRPVMVASDVCKSFGEGALRSFVIRNVQFAIEPGELGLLMGPSGSGKTTLISIMAGMLRPTSGSVQLCGEEISSASDEQIGKLRRSKVGFVFQSANLFPALTALENVAEVLRMKGHTRAAALVKARHSLQLVGLEAHASRLPAQLSGGQKQRVSIARALSDNPRLLIGDEMTSALDSHNAMEIMTLVRAHIGGERAALLVTHDPRLVRFADRVITMEDGAIVANRRIVPERSLTTGVEIGTRS
jgi:putative ABC transport system ATP-binding protein